MAMCTQMKTSEPLQAGSGAAGHVAHRHLPEPLARHCVRMADLSHVRSTLQIWQLVNMDGVFVLLCDCSTTSVASSQPNATIGSIAMAELIEPGDNTVRVVSKSGTAFDVPGVLLSECPVLQDCADTASGAVPVPFSDCIIQAWLKGSYEDLDFAEALEVVKVRPAPMRLPDVPMPVISPGNADATCEGSVPRVIHTRWQ
jgi:hypothetical protein